MRTKFKNSKINGYMEINGVKMQLTKQRIQSFNNPL